MNTLKKILGILLALTLLASSALAQEIFVFGTSEQGRELTCVRLGEENAEKSLLITFAVHGFEGAYDRDGQVLVDMASRLIAYFDANPRELCGYALYVVPCVNPDGLAEGTTEDGFGRANANGIDINRDFPAKWKQLSTARYRTGDAPFATAEARAIRDLVETIQPTYGVDVHGWIHGVYGSRDLAKAFQKSFGFSKRREYQSGGKLSQWLEEVTEAAVLIELPRKPTRENYLEANTENLIEGLTWWFSQSVKK